MEGKSKLTKEIVAQEARFILDNLITAGQYAKEVQFEELRRLCEQSVSLRLLDYINFLERFGYLSYDRNTHQVGITADGERVVGGEKVAELVIDVVHHFRPILSRSRTKEEAPPAPGSRPRPASAKSHELIDQRYEKVRSIGSGGIGTVYLARQVQLDREVALKEIRELFGFFSEEQRKEIVKRFHEEVRQASRLSHPNIASILDANTSQDYPYVVSEFISGGSLRRIIKLAESIPPELSVKVFLQILHALGHAHKHGVVHRSLKPENILFDSSGNVRVTDFGMSRVVERDQTMIQHVYVGTGSVAYMAPELFTDPGKAGVQSDLYALGILFYEMLARKLPGRRSAMPSKIHPHLPKVIDDIFDRLTQDEQADRYTSVDEVLEDFHMADASKDFVEPRAAVLFLVNPLDDLKLKEDPAETAASPGNNNPSTSKAATPSRSEPATTQPLRPPTPQPNKGQDATVVADKALDVATMMAEADKETGGAAVAPAATGEVPPHELPDSQSGAGAGSGTVELSSSEEEDDKPKRRSRVQRPYSFQQRVKKERDK